MWRSLLALLFLGCLVWAPLAGHAQETKRDEGSSESARERVFNSTDPGIELPRLIRETTPAHPETSEPTRARVAVLECVVRASGRADSCRSLRGGEQDFERAAIQEIEANWIFSPGTFRNRPVSVRVALEVRFDGSSARMR